MARGVPLRGLVFSALMAALTVVFTGAALLLPLPVHLALPTALAALRWGARAGLLSGAAGLGLAALLFGWPNTSVLLLPFGPLPGLALGLAARRQWAAGPTMLAMTAATLVGQAADLALAWALLGANPVDELAAGVAELARWVGRADLAAAAPDLLHRGLPAFLCVVAAAGALATYQVAALLLPRLGHRLPPPAPLGRWRIPAWTLPAYLLVLLARWQAPAGLAGIALDNLFWLLHLAFAVQGAGLALYWWWRLRPSRLVGLGGVALLAAGVAWPPAAVALRLAGMAEAALDTRRLGRGWPWRSAGA